MKLLYHDQTSFIETPSTTSKLSTETLVGDLQLVVWQECDFEQRDQKIPCFRACRSIGTTERYGQCQVFSLGFDNEL